MRFRIAAATNEPSSLNPLNVKTAILQELLLWRMVNILHSEAVTKGTAAIG